MTIGLAEARRRLSEFAGDAADESPLYAHLASRAAEDDEVAGLLAAAPESAGPALLLAVAHRLIQADPIHPLSRYYPSLGGFDGVDGETWPLFREFLLAHADEAAGMLATRSLANNEVRRAAAAYPGVAFAAKQAGGKIALLEVGTAGGLLLGMDKFAYRYQCDGGEQLVAGPAKAAVGLHCALDLAPGAVLPKLPKKLTVVAKAGLDPYPLDLSDEDELAWLEACVWADQPDRVRLLRAAALAQRKAPPEIVTGDAVDDLDEALSRLPADAPLVVLTSRTVGHIGDADHRAAFVSRLAALGQERPLWWVMDETYEHGLSAVLPGRDELAFARDGLTTLGVARRTADGWDAVALARTTRYGARMTWLAA
ncbi:DUF2332 domain-containing protein [Amycolatopsis thermophila]|uniref:DUF2332 domain-containing protein n=1 Tax=Amycolatopsis thermophila TaxID=206084 RepID=A0ABU0EQG8_9PSEU|nr:DUF2332 domain-containing protein [Amycolatopsis thermophila]MDQ0377241.1 hypothetical protein [Amycolatopsis thermophila]